MNATTLAAWGGLILVSAGGWFGLLAYFERKSRAGTVEPAPPSQTLAHEPPAIVHLITRRWTLGDDAVEATLLDLAARGIIEIRREGPGPEQAVIRIKEYWRPDLTEYEGLLLGKILQIAVADQVPLPALAQGTRFESELWMASFRTMVIMDARQRGLSQSRIGATVKACLVMAALVPALVTGLAGVWLWGQLAIPASIPSLLGLLLGIPTMAGLIRTMSLLNGERDTPQGRERAAAWLGVRAYLDAHPGFADLPPTAVSLWGRYFAYGAAFGLTHTTLRVLELGPGNDKHAWSAYGGTWRQIRMRYPWRPGFGISSWRALSIGLGLLGWAAIAWWAGVVKGADIDPSLPRIGWLLAASSGLIGVVMMIAAIVDLVAPRHIDGQILHFRDKEHRPLWGSEYLSTTRHWIAIDAGNIDSVAAWRVPWDLRYVALKDDIVRITVGRCFGLVRDIQMIKEGWSWRLEEN